MSRILLIEDDDQVRSLFEARLRDEGFDVTSAADGAVGLRLAAVEPPDLVITDVFMPERDGLEIIRHLRANDPDMPVIAISGEYWRAPWNVLDVAKRLGANCTMKKPVRPGELVDAARDLLANRRTVDPAARG